MATFVKPLHPEILWAQRSSESDAEKNIVYVTINTPDIQGTPTLDVTKDQLSFAAKTGDASKNIPEKEWACDLDLWAEIDPTATKKHVTSRAIVLVLRKKELNAEYWPRLTKEKPNRNWIKTDFSKWVDEDEQDEAADVDVGGMGDMGGMGGMGGMEQMMGGMGGMGGGMPGMPGMGGMGGMPGMGGMGGGPGGIDFAKLMEQMGGAGGMPDFGAGGEDDDEGDLDDAPAAKKADEPEVEEVE
ncbi:p23 chaperone protein wos2 [Vanrija albida]|uniref:P23 chaperone protein wos2 n=1 Tax=Vanrija albida TaxID=181172 RepID=A0ABR3PY77_9TREE